MKTLLNTAQPSYIGTIGRIALVCLIIGLVFFVYNQWEAFVLTTIEWQKTLHTMLASHISHVSEKPYQYGGALVAMSFGYGVFHAVGPGHGKAVIVTYLGTNNESVRRGIFISFSAAILQALIAIVLVSALARLLKFKLAEVHNYGNDMALVSYILVIMLGGMLVITALRRLGILRLPKAHRRTSHHDHHLAPQSSKQSLAFSHLQAPSSYGAGHDHSRKSDQSREHSSSCGCSHAHVPEENESIWQTLTVILSMGFRPCSGAIVVLIYAHLVGVYGYGVAATLIMGIGTGLSVSLIAVAALYARSWLERLASETGGERFFSGLASSHFIRLLGGVVLVILGWSFYSAATMLTSNHPLF